MKAPVRLRQPAWLVHPEIIDAERKRSGWIMGGPLVTPKRVLGPMEPHLTKKKK